MGSKPGSVVALEALLRRGWEIPMVVVSRNVSHPWMPTPDLETHAHSRGIPIRSQKELLDAPPVDFVISYMYRNRVTASTRALARRAALNFHAGPLPEFGGWAFYNVAILEERREYGCTCHYMEDTFDAGDLLKVRRFPIDPAQETAESLERRSQEEMIQLFLEFCALAESGGELPREAQDPARMRYLDQAGFEALKRIPEGADGAVIDRHARAFWAPPYGLAYLEGDGGRVEVVPACVKEALARESHRADLDRLFEAAGLERER